VDGVAAKKGNATYSVENHGGPGTELKGLLSYLFISDRQGCKCNSRMRMMNQWGCDRCEKRIDEIVGWLREEAEIRRIPFLESGARAIVMAAIAIARRKQAAEEMTM